MLGVVMLGAVMLNVVILNVVAPLSKDKQTFFAENMD